jgi:hypothetical protein
MSIFIEEVIAFSLAFGLVKSGTLYKSSQEYLKAY